MKPKYAKMPPPPKTEEERYQMNNLTVRRAENLQLNMIFIERRRKKMLLILDVIAVYPIIKVLEVFV